MAKGRIETGAGEAALAAVSTGEADRNALATAVRYLLQGLAERYPGKSVEVRIPPFGAVQCLEGPGHTRGTPPNVVETDAATFVDLAIGRLSWTDAAGSGRLVASGTRADLGDLFPLR
jgi:hypothetical protein